MKPPKIYKDQVKAEMHQAVVEVGTGICKDTTQARLEISDHPNWFFRISKYTMPFLKNEFVPETRFVNTLRPFLKILKIMS
ncbi:hypothetical protein [Pedobacter hartonius]|uniref:Uncharacterized protein n=1 Tax=Pedobacter hartonius TaxID=425514 RepID=A0A1H4FYC9_9SPHI|nr:hypothetical protein [Pedobacter hartonius]SEB01502.1 hypothetical protein SAMN05443550_108175 [Pedobacter hartonius]